MRLKKILTILLTLAMVVCLLPGTAYAANNTATTMRLAKVQGKVTVSNATGKAVSQTENMKLYNGYKVKTGAKSYAWISLDDTKVAKLDANSVLEVQKSGKSLTLYLSSGNIFFNVKESLKGGESFNIKTSTMTTGIRGTSGCVSVVNARVTEINLLTGKLEIVVEHPALGLKKTAVLLAGQSATSLIDWEAMAVSGEMAEIIIEALTTEDVCGNCAIEIAADPALLARIEKEAPQLLPALIAALAEEKLAADEAADAEKQQQIDDEAANQEFPEAVDPYFEEKEGGGGGGSSSQTVPSAPSTPTVNAVSVDSWTNAGNADAAPGLKEQLAAANAGEVDQIDLTSDVTVPADEEITVDPGTDVTLNLGTNTLTLGAEPNNQQASSIVNDGNLTITNEMGYIIGSGMVPAVMNNAGATLVLDIDGVIDANGGVGVENHGIFNMVGGEINTGGGVGVENYGNFTMSGGQIVGANDETGIQNTGGTVTLNSGAVLKDLYAGVENSVYYGEDGAEDVSAVLNVNGAHFENSEYSIINRDSKVTQTAATVKGIAQYETMAHIMNYGGTVELYGGEISCEGSGYGIMSWYGTVKVYDGTYDIYGVGGIYSQANGGKDVIQMLGGTLNAYGNSTAIKAVSVFGIAEDVELYLTGGRIVAEGAATAVDASCATVVMGDTELQAKTKDTVIKPVPAAYKVVYDPDSGYYRLVDEATAGDSNMQTVTTAAEFKFAIANGGSVILEDDITLTETVAVTKTTNLDLNGKNLTMDFSGGGSSICVGLDNSAELTISGEGGIIINGRSYDIGIVNSGTLKNGTATISGTCGTLIRNSGTLELDHDSEMNVSDGYGVDNTGKLIIDQQNGSDAPDISVNGGVGIYSHGTDAELILKTGYITAEDTATAIRFAGGKTALTGGEIEATGIAVDVSEGVPTYTAKINTIIRAQTKENVYKGSVPEGYYVKDFGYTGYRLVSCLDKDAFIQYVNSYSVYSSSTHQDVVMLGEDMTITASDVQGGMLTMEYVSQNSAGAALVIDLGGYTLTLDVPFAVADHVVITDSVGGGKVNGAAENLFIVKAKERTDYYGTVSYVYSSLTLEKGTIEVTAAGGNGIYLENAENKVILTGGRLTVADAAGYGIYNVNNGTIEGTGTVIEAAEGKGIGAATGVSLALEDEPADTPSDEPTDPPEGEENEGTDEINEQEASGPADNGGGDDPVE